MHEVAQIITRAGHRVVQHGHARPARAGIGGVLQPNVPRRTAGRFAVNADILAEIHEHVFNAVLQRHRDGAIHGVLLADAAEINAHARLREKDAALAALHLVPTYQFTSAANHFIRGNDRRIGLPIPQPHQRHRRRIERAARQEDHFRAESKNSVGLFIGFHPILSGGGVDSADETAIEKTRVLRFECRDPIQQLVEEDIG